MADAPAAPREFAVFDGDLDAAWAERFGRARAVAVDTEAMGLIHGRDRLVWCSFATPTIMWLVCASVWGRPMHRVFRR